jgi:hypothetical protein
MLLPGAADGTVSHTGFTSTRLIGQILSSTDYNPDGTVKPKGYTVRLLYGRRNACGGSAAWNSEHLSWNDMLRCPHQRSNAVPLTVGMTLGPGALLASSSGSGDFADASVSSNVRTPNSFTVRVSSSPSGPPVHVTWTLTCTKGQNVKGASGSFDDTTPVDDGSSIHVPFAGTFTSPDSCTIAVGASLALGPDATTTPSGTITLKLYVDKSHL